MCLLLIALDQHPAYSLILVANRDEFYDRPAQRAAFWEDVPELLAGRDLKAKGTWLGITLAGRLAAVTNYRDPTVIRNPAPSRGELVRDFLKGSEGPAVYFRKLSGTSDQYNGYNLIAGSVDELFWYSNMAQEIRPLQKGLYGLSNHLLDTPWPKVEKAKDKLSRLLSSGNTLRLKDLFTLLEDRRRPSDKHLPRTGVEIEWERTLSPVFIESPTYGTRSSTVVLVDRKNRVLFTERTFLTGHDDYRDIRYRFRLRPTS